MVCCVNQMPQVMDNKGKKEGFRSIEELYSGGFICAKHFTNEQFVVNPLCVVSIGYNMKKLDLARR